MKMVICDPEEMKRIIRRRQTTGADRFDEVWDGVYIMSPLGDNIHQSISGKISMAINAALGDKGAEVFPGCNVSDQKLKWKRNYRCPDVAVYLPGNPAEDRGSHWYGGPDFAVEVLSSGDRSRKKFDFYAGVGVRELLLVARKPWGLELYKRDGEGWTLPTLSSLDQSLPLTSDVLGLTFRLIQGGARPLIEILCPTDGRIWLT